MLLFQLFTFLVIFSSVFGTVFGSKYHDIPQGLNENEENKFNRCIKAEEKNGPDPEGACKIQCHLQAIGAIGTGKIDVKNIWYRTWSDKGNATEIPQKTLAALEANCSSLKATGRCELGIKISDCFGKIDKLMDT